MNLVLHLIMWPILGGIELNLLNFLEKYPDPNVHHIVAYAQETNLGIDGYYPGRTKLQDKIATLPNVELIKRGVVDNVDINDLISLVLKRKPDVIHATKEHDFPLLFALNLLTGVPVVPVLHQAPGKIFSEFFPIYSAMFNEYTHYQIGNYAGARYLYDLEYKCPAIKNLPPFEMIPNCVDATVFAPNIKNRAAIRTQYNIPHDAFVIGSVGVLDERKRQLWAIKALEYVMKAAPQTNIYCMLIGEGHLGAMLKEYVVQKGLIERVIFAGLQENIAPYYNALDMYVHPASTESCALACLEALACELPVVLYSPQPKGSVDRIYGFYQDGYNVHAVYENDEDAFALGVLEMVTNENYRKKLISVARTSAEEFSPARVAQRYHEIFTAAASRTHLQQIGKFKTLFNYYFPLKN